MTKIDFGLSMLQSLKTAVVWPILGLVVGLYGVAFFVIGIPVMFLFPKTVDKIAEFDDKCDRLVKGLVNRE